MDDRRAQDELSLLLRRHAELEATYGDGSGGSFLSGWQCENPWMSRIRRLVDAERTQLDSGKYFYLDDDLAVKGALLDFHRRIDGVTPQKVLCGAGASPIAFTFCAWLRERGVKEIFYVPPLYFSVHFALRLFDIRARPVSGRHAFESKFSMNLPNDRVVLLCSDPIWYAGMPLPCGVVNLLISWQRQTRSVIFIDGSFQYARWRGRRAEPTASLDPDLTVRLICPTKSLASHGYRFAYAIVPEELYPEFADLNSNIYGPTSVENVAFARAATKSLIESDVGMLLMRLVASRHQTLRAGGRISASWQPTCGYFTFERILAEGAPDTQLMDGLYFEQKRFPHHRRINLLSPSIHLLD